VTQRVGHPTDQLGIEAAVDVLQELAGDSTHGSFVMGEGIDGWRSETRVYSDWRAVAR
jgi:hypothetical protein